METQNVRFKKKISNYIKPKSVMVELSLKERSLRKGLRRNTIE